MGRSAPRLSFLDSFHGCSYCERFMTLSTSKSERSAVGYAARSDPTPSQPLKWTSAAVIGPALVPARMLAALRLIDLTSDGLNGTVTMRSPSWRSYSPDVASASCTCMGLGTWTFAV